MEKLIRDGRTLYNLHTRKINPSFTKGMPDQCNKFWMQVNNDAGGGITEDEAQLYAEQIQMAVNNYDALKEENERLNNALYSIANEFKHIDVMELRPLERKVRDTAEEAIK